MDRAVTTYEQNNNLSVFSDMNIMRGAEMLSKSDIIPQAFRGNPANVLVALDMAQRLNASPMLVMQNLYVIQGKPSWSSQYLIAMVNSSGRFTTPLQFDFTRDVNGKATACKAWAVSAVTGERITGPEVTLDMAKAEGWSTKSGSKWVTMPELMLTYRAAAFFARTVCPDIAMGMYTEYENQDIQAAEQPIQYEDKTASVQTQPEPAEAPAKAVPQKVRLSKAALALFGGDREMATMACAQAIEALKIPDANSMSDSDVTEAIRWITEHKEVVVPQEESAAE